jgi:hypothetical protein
VLRAARVLGEFFSGGKIFSNRAKVSLRRRPILPADGCADCADFAGGGKIHHRAFDPGEQMGRRPMNSNATKRLPWRNTLSAIAIVASAVATGCQSDFAGQTLPSAYYLKDDVQYFPPGPEFPHALEDAQIKAIRAEQELQEAKHAAPRRF